jgi:hypothetical protein
VRRMIIAVFASLASATAFAHSELPTVEWCANGDPVPVASFEFLPDTRPGADSDRRGDQCGSGQGGGVGRECGQFDDDYGIALALAQQSCAAHKRRTTQGDVGSVIFVAEQPATFLHEDHHRLYRQVHGLSGTCVRCEAVQQPAPVER